MDDKETLKEGLEDINALLTVNEQYANGLISSYELLSLLTAIVLARHSEKN